MVSSIMSFCSAELGVSAEVVRRIASQAPHKYKSFLIEKRRSGEFRRIAQPAREVKALQRAIVHYLQDSLRIHPAATAYVSGGSVVKNARPHLGARFILKLDFSSFFESIRQPDIRRIMLQVLAGKVGDDEIDLLSRAVCWDGAGRAGPLCLCIGAPSSPFFSNVLMYEFDEQIAAESKSMDVVYTRYSDDMTFSSSGREQLLAIEQIVATCCESMRSPRLRLNDGKRALVGRGQRLWVTGVCLSVQGAPTVGRMRKRGIRAGIDAFLKGRLSAEETQKLRGEIAFASSVERGFLDQLYAWYGAKVASILTPRV